MDLVVTAWASVRQGQVPPPEVVSKLISKALGYLIIAGAAVTKLPQVSNVLRSKSVEGLSALSFEMETLGLLIHTAYGYSSGLPFSAYGEAIILAAQALLLLGLIYSFSKAPLWRSSLWVAVYASLVTGVATGQLTKEHVNTLFSANTLLFMAARVPQILKAFSEKSTGQLSIVTFTINVVGCLVRIFTTLQEKAGSAMLRQYIISLALNGIIVAQILFYGGHSKPNGTGGKSPAKAKAGAKSPAAKSPRASKKRD